MTISSLMSSVSTLFSEAAPGEGGGVCSYAALPLLLGRSAKETTLACDDAVVDRGLDGVDGEAESEVCDRLIFFVGGCCAVSLIGEALETEGR